MELAHANKEIEKVIICALFLPRLLRHPTYSLVENIQTIIRRELFQKGDFCC